MTEPRRLWRGYVLYNPLFVTLVLLQALGLRRYSLDASGAQRKERDNDPQSICQRLL